MKTQDDTTATVEIYKDRGTWSADVFWSDGNKWVKWGHNYRSKSRLIEHAESFACVTNVKVRGQ